LLLLLLLLLLVDAARKSKMNLASVAGPIRGRGGAVRGARSRAVAMPAQLDADYGNHSPPVATTTTTAASRPAQAPTQSVRASGHVRPAPARPSSQDASPSRSPPVGSPTEQTPPMAFAAPPTALPKGAFRASLRGRGGSPNAPILQQTPSPAGAQRPQSVRGGGGGGGGGGGPTRGSPQMRPKYQSERGEFITPIASPQPSPASGTPPRGGGSPRGAVRGGGGGNFNAPIRVQSMERLLNAPVGTVPRPQPPGGTRGRAVSQRAPHAANDM
jgi:hypothetical protein